MINTRTLVSLVLLTIAGVAALILFLSRKEEPHVSREYTELKMLSAAIESYKTDHGHCPTDPATTEQLDPNTSFDPAAYIPACSFLYRSLSGDDKTSETPNAPKPKKYCIFPPGMLKKNDGGLTYIIDRSGNSLGYSTFKSAHPDSPDGHNPTFYLWSTGGGTSAEDKSKWYQN